jgi:hypothetical protein
MQVFSCTCYPNTTATTPHKLAPRSTRCVLLGYSSSHKGYCCLDLSTNPLIVSPHVVFDEESFPLAASPQQPVPVSTTPPPPLQQPPMGGQGVVVPVTPLENPHQMITRGKTGFRVVPDRLIMIATTSSLTPSPIPTSAHAALTDPNWLAAMEEYGALMSNGTWELVP